MPNNPPNPPLILPVLPREADVTLLQHGTLPPPARLTGRVLPELPENPPPTPLVPHAALQVAEAASALDPAERRPLLPAFGPNTNSTLAGQHDAIGPNAMLHPPLGAKPESSDVIQTFEAGPDDAHPGIPHPAAPQKTIAPGSGVTIPPPGKILRHGPPGQPRVPALRQPALAAAVPRPMPAAAAQPTLTPQVLPLQTEHVVALLLTHRQRQKGLDAWTRALEVAAVLAGVGVLLSAAIGALPVAGGLALAAIALAAQATTLRHVAHTSAQVSALLDALTGSREPPLR